MNADKAPEVRELIQAALPPDQRMDAYYFGFGHTGIGIVDNILSAVACAGKAYHHTEDWREENENYGHKGGRPEEWIQIAADDAATLIRALLKECDQLAEGYRADQKENMDICFKQQAEIGALTASLASQRERADRMEEALRQIALSGMSPSPEMSEDGVQAWHARQAWNFISIAARAISPDALIARSPGATE